eukprot:s4779_g2.t1
MPFEKAEHLEVENLRQARQAEEQLSSLSLALSKELQKHREANQSLSHVVESEQEELQGYAREEKLMQDAWNKERQTLAEDAATVATELDLSWCWNLGDRGLAALLNVAPGLQRLRLAGMKSLSEHGLVPCSRMPGTSGLDRANLEELDCTACNSVSDSFLEFLLRLFAGPLGSAGGDALPGLVPPAVRHASETLWAKRKIWVPRPEIRNYYAQRLEER